jgi:phosphoglycerate dehydrogenase-like enzyme
VDVLRLAWSSYQSEDRLEREAKQVEDAGYTYSRVDTPGDLPSDPGRFDVVIVNSQFSVDESFLDAWDVSGHVIVAANGFDQVDVDTCQQRGVTVSRTPEARADRVVEHTMTLIRALIRDLPASDRRLRRGNWSRERSFYQIQRLSSLTVGLLGFGVIGQRMAKRLENTDCYRVIAHDPHKEGTIESHPVVEPCSKQALFEESHVLSVHCLLNSDTKGAIGREELERLPDPAYLLNTARGTIVEPEAVVHALESGDLDGAGLDVFPEEPPEVESRNWPDNLIATPHSAGFGPGLLSDLTDEIIEHLNALKAGHNPPHCVTET